MKDFVASLGPDQPAKMAIVPAAGLDSSCTGWTATNVMYMYIEMYHINNVLSAVESTCRM